MSNSLDKPRPAARLTALRTRPATAGSPDSSHSTGHTALTCSTTRAVNNLTTSASKASKCSWRSFNMSVGHSSFVIRASDFKRRGFQHLARQREPYRRLRCFAFRKKTQDWAEECRQLGRIASREKRAEHARVIIPEQDRALVGQLDGVKLA